MRWLIALFVLLVAASGCERQEKEINIGVLYSAAHARGQSLKQGVTLAAEKLLDNGRLKIGEQVYRINFRYFDTGGKPETALQAAMTLQQRWRPIAVIGPNSSEEMAALVGYYEMRKIPIVSPAATLPELTRNKKYVFRLAATDYQQATALATYAYQQLKARRAAVLFDISNRYSRSVVDRFSQSFVSLGGAPVSLFHYIPDQSVNDKVLKQLGREDFDIILLPNFDEEPLQQMIRLRAAGVSAQFMGTDSWHPAKVARLPQAQGAVFSHHWSLDEIGDNPVAKDYAERYQQVYHKPPTVISALSFDATTVVIEALRRSRVTPQSLRYQILNTDNPDLVTGRLQYLPNGDPKRKAKLYRIAEGRIMLLEQGQGGF